MGWRQTWSTNCVRHAAQVVALALVTAIAVYVLMQGTRMLEQTSETTLFKVCWVLSGCRQRLVIVRREGGREGVLLCVTRFNVQHPPEFCQWVVRLGASREGIVCWCNLCGLVRT